MVTIILLALFFILLFIVLVIIHKRPKAPHIDIDKINGDSKSLSQLGGNVDDELKPHFSVYQINHKYSNIGPSDVSSPLGSPFKDVIGVSENITEAESFKAANFLLFSDFSFIDQNISNIPFDKTKIYYIYGLKGSDLMANKANLAAYMRRYGGQKYIPRSYILDSASDINQFQKDAEKYPSTIYILKKNVQRQEGTLISRDVNYITSGKAEEDGYVICQELLQNPYVLNGRKINLRIYLLVVKKDNKVDFYIYKDGFMYYTPKFFVKGSVDKDENITTGYIDRQVYRENPLTLSDFFKYLGTEKTNVIWNNMRAMFTQLKEAYKDDLYTINRDIPGYQFNIYGVDVAPDDKLGTMIIEINKGPDLSFKDERDKLVKLNLVCDMLTLMDIKSECHKSNFVRV